MAAFSTLNGCKPCAELPSKMAVLANMVSLINRPLHSSISSQCLLVLNTKMTTETETIRCYFANLKFSIVCKIQKVKKKIVKVCLHSSLTVQISFHFDDFFFFDKKIHKVKEKWRICVYIANFHSV